MIKVENSCIREANLIRQRFVKFWVFVSLQKYIGKVNTQKIRKSISRKILKIQYRYYELLNEREFDNG